MTRPDTPPIFDCKVADKNRVALERDTAEPEGSEVEDVEGVGIEDIEGIGGEHIQDERIVEGTAANSIGGIEGKVEVEADEDTGGKEDETAVVGQSGHQTRSHSTRLS